MSDVKVPQLGIHWPQDPPQAYIALAKLCVVFARRLMAAKVPLVEGTWRVAYEDRNPFKYWDESDPFTRSQYVRDAREFVLMAGYTGEWGPCVCDSDVGLKPERQPNDHWPGGWCCRCGGRFEGF
jgi:hypothetical protein